MINEKKNHFVQASYGIITLTIILLLLKVCNRCRSVAAHPNTVVIPTTSAAEHKVNVFERPLKGGGDGEASNKAECK